MGQKINPLGFRLGVIQKPRSQWFAKDNLYSQLVIEDSFLRKILFTQFPDAGITSIEIQRKLEHITLEIRSARPAILFGRDGNGLEELRKNIENKLIKFRRLNFYYYTNLFEDGVVKPKLSLHVIKLATPDLEAAFLADFVVEQLEKRVPFRRAVRQAIQRAQRAQIKGIKVQVSGRLNGAEIARSEWVREGRVPLQTLRANIDYSYKTAKTIYGIIGVKIWLFKGEVIG